MSTGGGNYGVFPVIVETVLLRLETSSYVLRLLFGTARSLPVGVGYTGTKFKPRGELLYVFVELGTTERHLLCQLCLR